MGDRTELGLAITMVGRMRTVAAQPTHEDTMRRLLPGSVIIVLASACGLAACSGGDGAAQAGSQQASAVVSSAPGQRVVHRMPTGSASTVSLRTLPNATCFLHAAGQAAGGARQLRVFADDDGVARVHLDHLDRTVRHGELALDCSDDHGARASHTIEIVIDDSAAPQAPAPYSTAGKPTLPKLDVPAASLTDAEIAARHYPPRPDQATSPSQYAAWLSLVSSEPTIVLPHVVDDVDRFHSNNANSNNWSGYVVTSPATAPIYAWIYGEWNVPRVYAESGFSSWDHSSMWVGIDGWGSGDVVQDGTDQDTVTFFWIQTSSYGAWTEWYPLSSQSVSNFSVNPGDDVRAWTWLTDSNGAYTTHPTVGRFYLWNATQNLYSYTTTNIPSGTTFNGHSAEWVMERPTVSGSTSSLANYSTAQMTGALTYDLNGGSHLYGGDASDTSWNVTMIDTANNNTVLSTVAPVSGSTMAFTFHNHQ